MRIVSIILSIGVQAWINGEYCLAQSVSYELGQDYNGNGLLKLGDSTKSYRNQCLERDALGRIISVGDSVFLAGAW